MNGDLDWLSPVATAGGTVIVAIVGAVALVKRRRQDRQDSITDKRLDKEPTEKDEWAEVRDARAEATRYYRLYRAFENLFYTAHSALRFLARKWHDGHPDEELDPVVVKALELRPPDDAAK